MAVLGRYQYRRRIKGDSEPIDAEFVSEKRDGWIPKQNDLVESLYVCR